MVYIFLNNKQPLYYDYDPTNYNNNINLRKIGTICGYYIDYDKSNEAFVIVSTENEFDNINQNDYEVGFLFNVKLLDETKHLYEIIDVKYATLIPIKNKRR